MMNEVLERNLLTRQLPDFVNDALGYANYGPNLASQTNDVISVGNHIMTIEQAMAKSADDHKVRASVTKLVESLTLADPSKFARSKRGFIAKTWNKFTGSGYVQEIQFDLYCRKVDVLVKDAPLIMAQAHESVDIIQSLESIYRKDIELLNFYINAGKEFISQLESREKPLTRQEEFGLSRLQRRIVNLELTKANADMSLVQIGMLLQNALVNLGTLNECINSVVPMWHHQVKLFRSGAVAIDIQPETGQRFNVLVEKLNNNLKKNKG